MTVNTSPTPAEVHATGIACMRRFLLFAILTPLIAAGVPWGWFCAFAAVNGLGVVLFMWAETEMERRQEDGRY